MLGRGLGRTPAASAPPCASAPPPPPVPPTTPLAITPLRGPAPGPSSASLTEWMRST